MRIYTAGALCHQGKRLAGDVLLDMPGKVRHVQERELEFTDEAPPGS